jgi:hypothetical protein
VGARQLPAPVRALADFLVERFEAPRAFPAPGQP